MLTLSQRNDLGITLNISRFLIVFCSSHTFLDCLSMFVLFVKFKQFEIINIFLDSYLSGFVKII